LAKLQRARGLRFKVLRAYAVRCSVLTLQGALGLTPQGAGESRSKVLWDLRHKVPGNHAPRCCRTYAARCWGITLQRAVGLTPQGAGESCSKVLRVKSRVSCKPRSVCSSSAN